MDNILLWALNLLIGVVLTFGGIILKNVNDKIKESNDEMKQLADRVDRHKEKLDLVILPNVGVTMCRQIQDGHENKHHNIDEALRFLGAGLSGLGTKTDQNREDIIRFEGKLDLILGEIKAIKNCSG